MAKSGLFLVTKKSIVATTRSDEMKINLVIKDLEYGRILAETISEIGKDIIVEINSDINNCVNCDITLTDIENADLINSRDNIVILTNNPNDVMSEDYSGGPIKLFKYNSLNNILSDIMHVHYVLSGYKEKSYGLLSRVFAVCTDGFDRSNLLAVSLARQILFRKGGDIIIVSMGYINDFPCLEEKDRAKFSRWMYYMDIDRDYSIDDFTYTDSYGISYLKLPKGLNPIAYMSTKAACEIIVELCRKKFETVILDIGNCYSKLNVRLLNKADNIAYLFEDDSRMNFHDLLVEPDIEKRLWTLPIKNGDMDIEILMDNYIGRIYGDDESGVLDE